MIQNMAGRDLLDYIDGGGSNVDHTPNKQLGIGSLSRSSRKSSIRQSGKFRKLYTPNKLPNVEKASDNCSEPHPKKLRLSLASHNATFGDGSHIDSSFDVVDVTPGIDRMQSLTFQSYLNNHTSEPGGNMKVITKSMQQRKGLGDSVNKNGFQSLSPATVSVQTRAHEQNAVKEEERRILGKKEGKSPLVSGITSLWAARTPPASSSKCRTPVHSVHDSSSGIIHRTPTRRPETVNLAKMDERDQILELTHKTPSRTGPQKSQQSSEVEADEHSPTQTVSNLLLRDVVAYVEVRSGGDNRSMGVKAHLRSLGAIVRDKFTNDVTHVVFNEGLWATYKKAMKKKVHLVSVLWIEECKNAQTIVSETLYPPFDMERYESPNLLKKFRKVKSLQPDFEDMGEEKITKRRRKKFVSDFKENEQEIELPEALTYKKQIKVPEFLQNVSNENGLVRTLLSVADIGPEYEEVVRRSTSPTLSEEENLSIPLAVRLLRKILTPQSSPELRSPRGEAAGRLKMTPTTSDVRSNPGTPYIQETPKRQRWHSPQRRNKDTNCKLVSDKNISKKFNKEADFGSSDTESWKANTDENHLSDSSSESPTLVRSDKVSVAKPCKLPMKNIKGSETQSVTYRMSAAKPGTTIGDAETVEKSNHRNEVWMGKKRKHNIRDEISNDKSRIKGNETLNTKSRMSPAKPGTTTGEAVEKCNQGNEVQKGKKRKCNTVGNIRDEISNDSQSEACNSKIAELHPSERVNTENLTVETYSTHPVNNEDQFANDTTICSTVSKGASVRRRKLLPLQQCNSPEVLNVSAVVDEVRLPSLQCPYTTEGEATRRRKRKASLLAGKTSAMELTACVPSTSTSESRRQSRQVRKNIDVFSNEAVSGVASSSRSSLDEFFNHQRLPKSEKEDRPQKNSEKKLPSLVCTSLHKHEVEVVASVVERLGGFDIEANVSERTTHVITKGPRRTLNLLKGIARGCWIVLQEWVLKSLDTDGWLEEDKFELADFSPVVKQCRMEKLSFGPVFKLDLFSTCGTIYVSKESVPPKRDLEELITLCGGRIVTSLRSARLLVGKGSFTARHEHVTHINEKWVLDSIQFNILKTLNEYSM